MRGTVQATESFPIFNNYKGEREPRHIVREEDIGAVTDFLHAQGYGVDPTPVKTYALNTRELRAYTVCTVKGEIAIDVSRFMDLDTDHGRVTGMVGVYCDIDATGVPEKVRNNLRAHMTRLYEERTKDL